MTKNNLPIAKPVVFISHIAEEAEIATALKDLMKPAFLELLTVFVSSDGESIAMGQRWLDKISRTLKECSVQVVICSPKSVARPWINFEAGAAWLRDIPVIPLCHSGLNPSQLPVPLCLLQAASLTDAGGINLVISVLAQVLGAVRPKVDISDFIAKFKTFEQQYSFWNECNAALAVLDGISPAILTTLYSHVGVEMDLPQNCITAIEGVAPFLRVSGLLDFQPAGRDCVMEPGGTFYGCRLLKLPRLAEILASPHLKRTPQSDFKLKDLPAWLVKPARG